MIKDISKLTRKNMWDFIQNELNKPRYGIGQILTMHLYCELFMNNLCSVLCGISIRELEKNTKFDNKRILLFENNIIDDTLNNDLIIINKIRNKLGHNLFPKSHDLIHMLKGHSNYWAENVMSKLGIYGKIHFVLISTVSQLHELYWKKIVKSDSIQFT